MSEKLTLSRHPLLLIAARHTSGTDEEPGPYRLAMEQTKSRSENLTVIALDLRADQLSTIRYEIELSIDTRGRP